MVVFRLLSFAFLAIFLNSCLGVNSTTFEEEHQDYLNTLSNTQDRQLLLNIVKMRYCDNPSFMEIINVTSQHSVGGQIGAGYNQGGAFSGVKFIDKASETISGQAAMDFRITPTVSYQPLQGQMFVQRLLRPLDADIIILLYTSGYNVRKVMQICLEEMNGMVNAPRASGPTPTKAPIYKDFFKATNFLEDYQADGRLDIFYEQKDKRVNHVLVIDQKDNSFSKNLNIDPQEYYNLVFNLRRNAANKQNLYLRSRSFREILFYVCHNAEVPEDHVQQGLVRRTLNADGSAFDWNQLLGNLLQIKCSEGRPDTAYIKVKYRGHWFYLDDRDSSSKETFTMLNNIYQYLSGNFKAFQPTLTIGAGG